MDISKKQVSLLLFIITTVSKFLILPSVYSNYAAQDVWFAGLLNFALDGALLATALLVLKKFEGRTLYEIFSDTIGKFGANAVFILYTAYFLLKATVPLFEQRNFIEITLYETLPSVITFLPFFFVAFYACVKGLKVMGRTAEMLIWPSVLGLLLAIGLAFVSVDFNNLQPVLKNPLKQTLTGSYSGLIWYGQPLMLFFLTGKIRKEKHFNAWATVAFCAAAFLSEVIFVSFTAIYGVLAPREIYALPKMTKYGITLANILRFDYIATLLLLTSSTLSLTVPLIFAVECLCEVFGENKRTIFSAAIAVSGAILTVVMRLRFREIVMLFEKYFTPIMCVLCYIIPLITLIFGRKNNEKILEK